MFKIFVFSIASLTWISSLLLIILSLQQKQNFPFVVFLILFFYIITSTLGVVSVFYKKRENIFLKIFSISLILTGIALPFAIITNIVVPIIIYLLFTIGSFLFQKSKSS